MSVPDVVVVGSGPNGLAAAVTAARAGLDVLVLEAAARPGGGASTAETTLPGFRHDLGSAVHPAALASPFLRATGLVGAVDWLVPEASYGHPLDGRAVLAWRDLERTADGLGADGRAWRGLLGPLVDRLDGVLDLTGHRLGRRPADPIAAVRFARRVLEQGGPAWGLRFRTRAAAALLTGVMAHAAGPLPHPVAAGAGLLLAAHGHAGGWPVPHGGAQAIADALLAELVRHGGRLETGVRVRSLDELPPARLVLLDTAPRLLLAGRTGQRLPARYAHALRRFRYGPGAAKVDFALAGPVPWRDRELARTVTVHLGGDRAAIRRAEAQVAAGRIAEHPYVLLAQPSTVDASRAPAGRAVLWAYTHVPNGSPFDATEAVTAAIEAEAPGFRDLVLAAVGTPASAIGAANPTLVGGDVSAGALSAGGMLRRPIAARAPWRTPLPGVYLCSASTPPGPAVHGVNGWTAARLGLRERFGIDDPADDRS